LVERPKTRPPDTTACCGSLTELTAPYDEPEILDDDVIIRRVDPVWHVIFDDNRNCHRLSSKLYKASSGINGGMSVDIEKLINAEGLSPQQFVLKPPYLGAVAFSARAIRSFGLWIGYEPIQENPYHGEVWNSTTSRHNKFTNSQVNSLMQIAKWYVQLDDVEIS
jgi:hypothetical protein